MEFGFWGLVLLLPVIVVSDGGGGGGGSGGAIIHGLKKSEQKPFRFKNPGRVGGGGGTGGVRGNYVVS